MMRIHRAKMPELIELCKRNILDFLESAEILNKSDNTVHASILVGFALEEYGKIMILEDALKKHNDPVVVDRCKFTNHDFKEQKYGHVLIPNTEKSRLVVSRKVLANRFCSNLRAVK